KLESVEGVRMRILTRRSTQNHTSTLVIDPYGLVAISGRWYLVADDRGAGRLFSVERLSAFERLDVPATLRPGQGTRLRPRDRWTARASGHRPPACAIRGSAGCASGCRRDGGARPRRLRSAHRQGVRAPGAGAAPVGEP